MRVNRYKSLSHSRLKALNLLIASRVLEDT